MFVQVNQLPQALQNALTAVDYNRKDIDVRASETASIGFMTGDGYQAFTAVVNLGTREFKIERGSWGGGNMFTQTVTDNTDAPVSLINNVAVIKGRRGGSKPVMAEIVMHPTNVAALLPTNDVALSIGEKRILLAYIRFNSTGRSKFLSRFSQDSRDRVIASLASKGLLKVNKAGAASVTTEGKNAASQIKDVQVY